MWAKIQVPQHLYVPYMRRGQVREAVQAGAILLLPVATIEQHGDHAPLHTDIDNVFALCVEAARKVDSEPRCVVGPPVWWSISPFDIEQYPGCMRMREEVFKEALGDVVESFIFSGFRKIVLVNGHGGGTEWMLPELVRRINRRESHLFEGQQLPEGVRVVTFMWLALLEVFAQKELMAARGNPEGCADWHGGDIETSLQLYLHPELVDMDAAKPGNQYQPLEFAPYDIGHSWFWQYILAGYPPGPPRAGEVVGISGDPSRSSAEVGRKVLELGAEVLAKFVREFAGR